MDVLRLSEWGWRRSRRLSRRGDGPGGFLEDALRLASQRLQILTCYGRNLCLSCGPIEGRFLFLPGKRSNHPLFRFGQHNA